jgi:ABC-type transport system involved in multi-copper enzyme maturation permease subunit
MFTAMLVDAYRELSARKLFWITLALSGLIVLFYGSMGFHETGMSMFYGLLNIESEFVTKGSLLAQILYRSIFTWFMVSIWLAWAATIIALISTSAIFPDFVASGGIDLVLSKPIRRTTLFATKYVLSLLFVILQVSLFSAGVFLCLGIRLGDWDPKIFAAIPVVTVFYSYLFSITVLVGVWSRSAITALLATFIFWSSLFGINLTEGIFNRQVIEIEIQLEAAAESAEQAELRLTALDDQDGDPDEQFRARLSEDVANARRSRDELQAGVDRIKRWYKPFRVIQAIFPKTGETVGLLDRWLKRDTDVNMLDILAGNVTRDASGEFVTMDRSRERETQRRMEESYVVRPVWYVVGTSLIFELVVLSGACVIFVRRDF